MKKSLCICMLLASQAAFAGDVFSGTRPRYFSLAEPLEADATVGGYPVWQGERPWQIFGILRNDSTGASVSIPLGQLRVFQTEGKKLVSVMQVSANLSGGSVSDWIDEPCKRDDLLFKASLGGRFRNVNCVTINHVTGYFSNPTDSWATLYAHLKDQEVDVPPTVLQLAFTRYSDMGRRLVVTLSINPELAGFARDAESWGRSSWHKSQSLTDPEKKRFIDALSAWSLQFAKQMDRAFDKRRDAFLAIPSWRSALDSRPAADHAKPGIASLPPALPAKAINPRNEQAASVEDRLKELKRLFDAGLITPDVYSDRQKAILH